jgi:hypothetical protein
MVPRYQGVPPDLAAADRGPEREFVRYPMGYLGLHRINHTRFRGTEFCAADQFSVYHIASFRVNARGSIYFSILCQADYLVLELIFSLEQLDVSEGAHSIYDQAAQRPKVQPC